MEQTLDDIFLQKRIKTRKITCLVISIFTLLVALTVIIMACVSVDLRPKFIENPNHITIYSTEVPSGLIVIQEDNENLFLNKYDEAFRISSLSALFSGNFGDYDIDETYTPFDQSDSALKNTFGNNFVKMTYSTPQEFKTRNGQKYVSKNGYNNITFDAVYFSISENNSTQDITLFFAVSGNITNSSSGQERRSITKIKLRANTYSLYELIGEYK